MPAPAALRITTVSNRTADAGHFVHLRAGHIDFLTLTNGLTHTYKLINRETGESGETDYRTGRAVLESAARNAAHQVTRARAQYAREAVAAA